MLPNVQAVHEARLKAALEDPQWEDAMVLQILQNTDQYFRWFDSGDVQSFKHARAICNIASRTPTIKHWLPSHESDIWGQLQAEGVIPANLIVRLSGIKIGKKRRTSRFPTSMVIKASRKDWEEKVTLTDGIHYCPGPLQDEKCGTCRACWSAGVRTVAYRQH